mgnify:CR=1 FL=1
MTATKDDFYHVGLTDDEVRKSRTEHGVNLLTPPKRPSLWKLYLEKFEDPVVRVLLVAAFFSLIISMVENEYAETIGIIAAILLATGIGFFFEYDANKKFDLLNAVNEETLVKVIRNGRVQEIPRKEVVVGDIIILETGEEIPADGELLEAISLQVNESNLTGEPVIAKTIVEADFDEEVTYASNRVLRGTTVVDGHGMMRVEAGGAATGWRRYGDWESGPSKYGAKHRAYSLEYPTYKTCQPHRKNRFLGSRFGVCHLLYKGCGFGL